MLNNLPAWYARHKLWVRMIAGLAMLYLVAGFAVAPLVVRHIMENNASAALHRDVRAASVRTNPLTFSLQFQDLAIAGRDKDAPFVRVGRLYINADPLASLFRWGVAIRTVQIDTPSVRIIRDANGGFNFSDMLSAPSDKPSEETDPESSPVRLVMGEMAIVSGEILFADATRDAPFETRVTALNVSLNGMDTRPDAEAFQYTLSGQTEAGEQFEIGGRSDFHPFSVEARATLKHLVPAKYAPYYRPHLGADVADGRIDIGAQLQWSDKTRAVTGLQIAVKDLVLRADKDPKPLVRLPRLTMEDAGIDLANRHIRLGRIHSRDARIFIQRGARGQLNLQTAFAPRSSEASAAPAGQEKEKAPSTAQWKIIVPELKVEDYAVDFEDLQPSPPVRTRLHRIDLAAEELSNEPQAQGKIDVKLHWADQGTLAVRGNVSLAPPKATLDLAADKLDIRPLQPYLREFVKLVFTKGEFSAHGRLQWAPKEEDTADLRYSGQASLDSLEAVDTDKAELFSKWKSLYLTGIEIGTVPPRAQIEKVALTDFFNRLLINADGTVNIETILASSPAPEKTGKSSGTAPAQGKRAGSDSGQGAAFSIKTITLQGGRVDFNDKYIKPPVHLIMEDLGGTVTGLDNIRENKADVRLQGKVGGNVPLEIKGRVNPLIEKPFVDLSLNFPDFDLSPFTPYSGKYLGYTLKKGQLAFTLEYQVADNKLTGQNKIQLNQLTFGEPVASPQATQLPIKLAVALLKDRSGNIDLDLPVKGDLDDPQFSLGGVILKMFVNLISQIASSPFKMLGAVFGGGEELAYLDFDPGRSTIFPTQMEKLNTLENIFYERPGLRLEIQGRTAPEPDSHGLRQLRFEEQLKSGKLKTLVASGRRAVPLDSIEISPEERAAMVQKAFDAAEFPKPRDEKGRLKKIPSSEMEKLLLTAIDIDDDDLRRLAHDRASAAKTYLLSKGRIESGRLFVVEPRIKDDRRRKEAKPQVQFNLK